MTMSTRSRIALAALPLALLFLSGASAQAQEQYDRGTPPQLTAGVSPGNSYESADIGAINLSNGALNMRIPMGNVGGRGFWLPITLNYSSKVWSAHGYVVPAFGSLPPRPTVSAVYGYVEFKMDKYNRVTPGWTWGGMPALLARGVPLLPQAGSCATWGLVKLTLVLPDKGEVQLRDDMTEGSPLRPVAVSQGACPFADPGRGTLWHATDGSGTIFINDNNNGVSQGDLQGWVITGDGMRYHFVNAGGGGSPALTDIHNLARCDKVVDRNGNFILVSYSADGNEVDFTDQLGRTTTVKKNTTDPENPGVSLALLVTLPGYRGGVHYYKVVADTMSNHYRSGINPQLPVLSTGATSPSTKLFPRGAGLPDEQIDNQIVVTQIILPDHRTFQIAYNEFGEVAEVVLPTGAKVQYDYLGMSSGLPSGNTPTAETVITPFYDISLIDRAVIARRTYLETGVQEGTWKYSYGPQMLNGSSTPCTEVICKAAASNALLYWFSVNWSV